jgi:hypothetical protein
MVWMLGAESIFRPPEIFDEAIVEQRSRRLQSGIEKMDSVFSDGSGAFDARRVQ